MLQHLYNYRVCYADTDLMDRVYYANYLVICERARTEFLRDIGHPYKEIESKGIMFPVRNCQIRYFGYAEYDDQLVCKSWIAKMRHATLTIATDIYKLGKDDKPLISATVELACTSLNGKPTVLPEDLKTALVQYVEG